MSKILYQCSVEMRHAVKSRLPINSEFDEFMEQFTETVSDISKNKIPQDLTRPLVKNDPSKDGYRNSMAKQIEQKQATKPDEKVKGKEPTCFNCGKTGHRAPECKSKNKGINNLEAEPSTDNEEESSTESGTEEKQELLEKAGRDFRGSEEEYPIEVIEAINDSELNISELLAEANIPVEGGSRVEHIMDARLMCSKPAKGRAHTIGSHCLTNIIYNKEEALLLLDTGASCSIVGESYIEKLNPRFKDYLMPLTFTSFRGCGGKLQPLGIIETHIIFPHIKGSVRIQCEFVVMKEAPKYFILGSDFLTLYGIDIVNSREKYFTIGNDNKSKKFLIIKNHNVDNVEKYEMPEQLKKAFIESNINIRLDEKQQQDLNKVITKNKNAFAFGDRMLGKIIGHEVEIKLTINPPYPPILRKPPYPASPRCRETLEEHITELIKL